MTRLRRLPLPSLLLPALLLAMPGGALPPLLAQGAPGATAASRPLPPRAIRRDIPLPNGIRRALAAGTRDSTGRPGPRYWQLRTDYAIDVALEPGTHRLTGTARITVHNRSPEALRDLTLKLYPNHFLGTNPHAAPWVPAEVTDGMVITRMAVDGAPVDVASNAPVGDGSSRCDTTALSASASWTRICRCRSGG